VTNRVMGFIAKWGEKGTARQLRYKDGLWAEYCRVPATNVVVLRPDDDLDEVCKVSQIAVGYRALKRARLHSGETVIVNGASGIAGIGTVMAALAIGAANVIAVARNPERLEKLRAIDPKRVKTVALARGESITQTVKEVTHGDGANVVADLTPSGVQSLVECIGALEGGGRVTLIGANPEPLGLSVRYLMIRSIEITSVTGRYYTDIPEVLELARNGVIDTRHITAKYFPLAALNDALDYIHDRGPSDPAWPMYAAAS
jgi:alcohol dehydrogenase